MSIRVYIDCKNIIFEFYYVVFYLLILLFVIFCVLFDHF